MNNLKFLPGKRDPKREFRLVLCIENYGDVYWTMRFEDLKSFEQAYRLIDIHGHGASSITLYLHHNMEGGVWRTKNE